MLPAKVVVVDWSTARLPLPRVTVPLAVPLRGPTTWSLPLSISKVPPLTMSAPVPTSKPPLPRRSVPASTVVAPA